MWQYLVSPACAFTLSCLYTKVPKVSTVVHNCISRTFHLVVYGTRATYLVVYTLYHIYFQVALVSIFIAV
jgi:hypothetical protein